MRTPRRLLVVALAGLILGRSPVLFADPPQPTLPELQPPVLLPPGLEDQDPNTLITSAQERRPDDSTPRPTTTFPMGVEDDVHHALIPIDVLTARTLNAFGWRTLDDLLQLTPSIQSRRASGHVDAIAVRGLLGAAGARTNSRLVWLSEGLPMLQARDQGWTLNDTLPVELIRHIDIVAQPLSAVFGPGASAGALNVQWKRPEDIPALGIYRVVGGTFETLRASATTAARWDTGGTVLHASALGAQGAQLVTPNTARRAYHARAHTFWHRWRWILGWQQRLNELEGTTRQPTSRAQHTRDAVFSQLRWDDDLSSTWHLDLGVNYQFVNARSTQDLDLTPEDLRSPDGMPAPGITPDWISSLDDNTQQHHALTRVQSRWQLTDTNTLSATLEGRLESIHGVEFTPSQQRATWWNLAAALHDEQRLLDQRLRLLVGGRIDQHRDFGLQPSWHLAAAAQWLKPWSSQLRYATGYRDPSWAQRFTDTLDERGDAALVRERSQSITLTNTVDITSQLMVRAELFVSWIDDLLIERADPTRGIPVLGLAARQITINRDDTTTLWGLELSTRWSLSTRWLVRAHYRWLNPSTPLLSGGYDAQHLVNVSLAWLGRFINASLWLTGVGPTQGPRLDPLDPATVDLPGYAVLRPCLNIRLPGNLGLLLQARYTFSEGFEQASLADRYFETVDVPVSRFDAWVGLQYPFVLDAQPP